MRPGFMACIAALLFLPGCGPSASSKDDMTWRQANDAVSDVQASLPDGTPDTDQSNTDQAAKVSQTIGRDDVKENRVRPAEYTNAEDTRVRPRLSVRAGGLRDLTFDDLEFGMEPDADFERSVLGEKIEKLDGKRVVIRGFILASSVFQQKGIKQFILVRDNQQCCFGPGAYIYHNMQVQMEEGQTANFGIRPVTVEGQFAIKPWIGPDGKCYSVYHLTARSVK